MLRLKIASIFMTCFGKCDFCNFLVALIEKLQAINFICDKSEYKRNY